MRFRLSETDRYDFQNPKKGFKKAQRAMGEIPPEEFFGKAGEEFKNIRELWLASLFGQGLSGNGMPCEIQLVRHDPPDFILKEEDNACEYPFEITEKMEPGYRRGKEYRDRIGKEGEFKSIDIPDINEVPGWICEAIEKKATRYGCDSSGMNLLIYTNIWIFDELNLEAVRDASLEFQEIFSSIWLLRDSQFAKLWSDGIFEDFSDGWLTIPARVKQITEE